MAGTDQQPDGLTEGVAEDLELRPDQAKDVKGGIRIPKDPPVLLDADAPAGP